jgi:DNA repair protein RadC
MNNQALFQLTKTQTDFPRVKITSSKDAYQVISQYYGSDIEIYESFFILLVDRSNTTVGYAKISQGGIAGTVVDIKIIAKYCLDSLCSGVILAHNHPSGNLKPSPQDESITKKIQDALGLLEVNVLDHLILTSNSYYSFKDEANIL